MPTVTDAEYRVARAVLFDGATDETAARRLFTTHWTVKTHLRRLYLKTGVHTRTALAVAVWSGQVQINRFSDNRDLLYDLRTLVEASP